MSYKVKSFCPLTFGLGYARIATTPTAKKVILNLFIKNATLYANGGTYNGKTITTVYTGFATTTYTAITTVPWYNNRTNITNVKFENEISPVSTAYWFAGFINCTEFNLTNLNTTNIKNDKSHSNQNYQLISAKHPKPAHELHQAVL